MIRMYCLSGGSGRSRVDPLSPTLRGNSLDPRLFNFRLAPIHPPAASAGPGARSVAPSGTGRARSLSVARCWVRLRFLDLAPHVHTLKRLNLRLRWIVNDPGACPSLQIVLNPAYSTMRTGRNHLFDYYHQR